MNNSYKFDGSKYSLTTKNKNMNRLIILLLVLFALMVSCNNNNSHPYLKHNSDTLLTIRSFVGFPDSVVKFDAVYRVTLDTLSYRIVDSETVKKSWIRDTVYFIPFKDSLKRITYYPTIKGSVYEGDNLKEADSLLHLWIKAHSQYFKTKTK